MPLNIPAFDQYQQPMIPLRGLWNCAPPEGDKYVNAEIDWLVTTRSNAVQFSLSGNSPVSLSQIAALGVDNSRSGADVAFIFPDSGWELVVPAHNQLISPVFTNALMFYASAPSAITGDVTVFQVFNSVPPPVPIAPSVAQNHGGIAGLTLANGTTQIVPPGVNGTLNTIAINVDVAAGGICQLNLIDGGSHILWVCSPNAAAGGSTQIYNLTGLAIRFISGMSFQIVNSTFATGSVFGSVYYSTP